jgi:transposase
MVFMARPSLLRFSDEAKQELLNEARGSSDPDFRDACRAIIMLGGGAPRDIVADQFGVHPATIGRWAASYRKRSIGGLRGPEEDARGRPAKLDVTHLELLKEIVLLPPRQLGYAFANWTLPRLATVLKKRTGASVRPHYLGLLLHRMGITRKRPKHVLDGKRDEAAHDQAKAELQRIKRNLGQMRKRVVIIQDETEFHLYPYLVAIWSVVGTPQPEVMTPGKNQKRVLYGGLNLKTGRLTGHWATTKSGGHFVQFLEVLLADYPDQNILMIADNGTFHHTRQVEHFLEGHKDRIEVRWLPPYCPDLNDIERTWRRPKASHASNFLFNSLDELVDNVQTGIQEMNRTMASH